MDGIIFHADPPNSALLAAAATRDDPPQVLLILRIEVAAEAVTIRLSSPKQDAGVRGCPNQAGRANIQAPALALLLAAAATLGIGSSKAVSGAHRL